MRRRIVATALAMALAVGLALAPAGARITLAASTATDDAYAVDEDTTLVIDPAAGMLANDVADPGTEICVLSIDVGGLVGSVDSYNTDGRFEYTPDPDWNGQTIFLYVLGTATGTSCDADSGASATVRITVNAVNDRPVAQTDTFQALRDRTLTVAAPGILGNDFDVDGDALSAVKESNPAHGSVTLAADGAFSYTPAAGYVGPDGFSYRASDGTENSPIRVVSITVTALPTPPPTAAPTPTPEPPATATPEPSPTGSPDVSASPEASVAASAGPSGVPSPSPVGSLGPTEPAGGSGGLSIPVIVVGLLLASLLAFGGAVLLPKWLEQRRAGTEPPSPYRDRDRFEDGERFGDQDAADDGADLDPRDER